MPTLDQRIRRAMRESDRETRRLLTDMSLELPLRGRDAMLRDTGDHPLLSEYHVRLIRQRCPELGGIV